MVASHALYCAVMRVCCITISGIEFAAIIIIDGPYRVNVGVSHTINKNLIYAHVVVYNLSF